jgi:hypothetical protein
VGLEGDHGTRDSGGPSEVITENEPSSARILSIRENQRLLVPVAVSLPRRGTSSNTSLVSAPSVNQMIRTLERRGFIARDRDWFGQTMPRSIRVLWDD